MFISLVKNGVKHISVANGEVLGMKQYYYIVLALMKTIFFIH